MVTALTFTDYYFTYRKVPQTLKKKAALRQQLRWYEKLDVSTKLVAITLKIVLEIYNFSKRHSLLTQKFNTEKNIHLFFRNCFAIAVNNTLLAQLKHIGCGGQLNQKVFVESKQ